jgi:hypothetical protein
LCTCSLNRRFLFCRREKEGKPGTDKAELKSETHRNSELQEAWNSLGASAFEFEVLDVLEHEENSRTNPAEELQVLVELWIRKLEDAGYPVESLQPHGIESDLARFGLYPYLVFYGGDA